MAKGQQYFFIFSGGTKDINTKVMKILEHGFKIVQHTMTVGSYFYASFVFEETDNVIRPMEELRLEQGF